MRISSPQETHACLFAHPAMAPTTRSQRAAYKTSAAWHEQERRSTCDPDGWRMLADPRHYYWCVLIPFSEYVARSARSTQRGGTFWHHLFKRPALV